MRTVFFYFIDEEIDVCGRLSDCFSDLVIVIGLRVELYVFCFLRIVRVDFIMF